MDLRIFVLLVITVATWSEVLGQPAFDTSSCDDLTALSGVGTVVGGNAPFSLASLPTTYSPGGAPVQVFLFSPAGRTQFSSVILQARRVDNGAVVGSFDISNNAGFEFLACGDRGMATVITSGRNPITVTFITMWNPRVSVMELWNL
ncbi:putative ferric-chelate reductase 1, partial [Apostichopus japonicus]